MSKSLQAFLTLLGIDMKNPKVKIQTTPEQVKQGIISVSISIDDFSQIQKLKMKEFAESIGTTIVEDEIDSMYVGISDYLKACKNQQDDKAGKKLRTVSLTYGMLLHEAAMFMYINDAAYDWEFLNGLLMDLPETHSPLPTFDRFKESMKWISRTIDTVDNYYQTKRTVINQNYGRYIKNLKLVFQLVCAEQAKSYGFDLDFNFEEAEYVKTIPIAKLYMLPFPGKPRNVQHSPAKDTTIIATFIEDNIFI